MSTDLALDQVRPLSRDDAQRLTAEIRHALGSAILGLQLAREGRADTALGYPTWHEYVEAEFGDLRELRLPVVERRALATSMHGAGLSYRQIRDKLDVSLGTIRNDIGRPADEPPADVVQLRPAVLPAPTGRVYVQAAEWLRRAAAGLIPDVVDGLTLVELARVAGWTEGKASGALSYLRAPSRGLAVRVDDRRADQRVHVLTELGSVLLETPVA